jgi:predicted TIM-barrel fold metal-dependent hydrolase
VRSPPEQVYVDTFGFWIVQSAFHLLFGTDAPYEPRSVVEGQRFVRAIEDVTSNVDSKKILADNAIELLDR